MSIIVRQLFALRKFFLVSLAFIISAVAMIGNTFLTYTNSLPTFLMKEDSGFDLEVSGVGSGQHALTSIPFIARAQAEEGVQDVDFGDPLSGILFSDNGKILSIAASKTGVIPYTIVRGDTLSGVATKFGITMETLLGANPNVRANALQVGDTLNILPISGVLYTIRQGQTAESIASLFGLTVTQLQEFNRLVDFNFLTEGSTIVIPGAKPFASSRGFYDDLPSVGEYFRFPVDGFNWGVLHRHNAVDIAAPRGTPIYSAADGLVVPDKNYGSGSSGWNGGYGKFVLLEHPNGTKTRYAHLDDATVSVGEYITAGTQIGTIGNTGNVHGPTGYHLHFEVHGAKNPFSS